MVLGRYPQPRRVAEARAKKGEGTAEGRTFRLCPSLRRWSCRAVREPGPGSLRPGSRETALGPSPSAVRQIETSE